MHKAAANLMNITSHAVHETFRAPCSMWFASVQSDYTSDRYEEAPSRARGDHVQRVCLLLASVCIRALSLDGMKAGDE